MSTQEAQRLPAFDAISFPKVFTQSPIYSIQDGLWRQMYLPATASLSEVEKENPQDLHEDFYSDFVANGASLELLERALLSNEELSTR